MHEASLMKNLMRKIEDVAREAKASRVAKVKVKLGALSHMSEEHFREHFETSSAGTVAEGAEVMVKLETDTNHPQAQDIILESVDVSE